MQKRALYGTILVSSLILMALTCNKYKYYTGSFPEMPTNLAEFNTEFDDYNAASPILGETFPLCFSSTRNSNGANYDIIYKLMTIEFSRTDGTLRIFENTDPEHHRYSENSGITNALERINTSFDEFGPYLVPMEWNFNGNDYQSYFFLYSNNSNGNQDIMFTHNLEDENYVTPLEVDFLNSEFDDAYPTFNNDDSEIYFTSNREEIFNIFKVRTDNNKEILEILTENSPALIEKDTVLSSAFDDKCPFISHDLMVFTSNREGGFGGYDLYYSRLEDGKWGDPVNFGGNINSEYDEYRPIVRPQWDFANDFMLFSSNRPGGKGGFDLYYVGIDKINRDY